jgi:hypothetical protein
MNAPPKPEKGSHKHEPFIASPVTGWLVLGIIVAAIFLLAKIAQSGLF